MANNANLSTLASSPVATFSGQRTPDAPDFDRLDVSLTTVDPNTG